MLVRSGAPVLDVWAFNLAFGPGEGGGHSPAPHRTTIDHILLLWTRAMPATSRSVETTPFSKLSKSKSCASFWRIATGGRRSNGQSQANQSAETNCSTVTVSNYGGVRTSRSARSRRDRPTRLRGNFGKLCGGLSFRCNHGQQSCPVCVRNDAFRLRGMSCSDDRP